jgi:hypothetical protein
MAKTVTKYPARAVKTVVGEESHSGTLTAGPEVLKFESPDTTLEFDYEELQLEVSNAKNSPVGFTHPDHPGWKLTAYEHRILREGPFRERDVLRHQVEAFKARKEGVGRVLGMFFFVTGLVGVATVLGWYFDQTLPRLVEQLDPVYEGEVGDRLTPLVADQFQLVEHPGAQAALDSLLERMLPDDQRLSSKFSLKLIAGEDPEMFSLPNGEIYIFTGAIQLAKGEAGPMAALLARELVHLNQRHALRQIIAKAGPQLLLDSLMGKSGGVKKLIDRDFEKILRCNYSEEIQMETDRRAVQMLVTAKIDVNALETILNGIYTWQSGHGWSEDGEHRNVSTHLPTERQALSLRTVFNTVPAQGEMEQLPAIPIPANTGPAPTQPAVNF